MGNGMDWYTKAMLTIIAFCLVVLTLKDYQLIPQLKADNEGLSSGKHLVDYALMPVNEDGSVSVRLINLHPLDVNIARIGTSDELEINIAEIGGSSLSSGGPIPVEIDD